MYTDFETFAQMTIFTTVGQGECWDYINLPWNHEGSRYYTYPPSDPGSTNHGVKWGVINAEARQANTIANFEFISDIYQVKRGDIVVISGGEYGHAGFAVGAYDGGGRLNCYSQNVSGRRSVAIDSIGMDTFVGAFRYLPWQHPTPPPISSRRSKFPWVLYANKIRNRF